MYGSCGTSASERAQTRTHARARTHTPPPPHDLGTSLRKMPHHLVFHHPNTTTGIFISCSRTRRSTRCWTTRQRGHPRCTSRSSTSSTSGPYQRAYNKQSNIFHPSSSLFSPTFFARYYHSLSLIMFSITAHNCASLALFAHSLHHCSHHHYAQLFYGRPNKASPSFYLSPPHTFVHSTPSPPPSLCTHTCLFLCCLFVFVC
jgi:hypothetical protein